jgi:MFS family permease
MTLFSVLYNFVTEPYADTVKKLRIAPKELFRVFIIAFFVGFGMAGPGIILVSYFSDEFKFSDIEAATLFATSALGYVIYGLFTGLIIDRIGIKNSLVVGGILGVTCSITIGLAATRGVLIFAVVVMLPLSTTFVLPVIKIAQKRYTYSENKRIAFWIGYVTYNAGVMLSFYYVDFVRYRFSEGVRFRMYSATASRFIFLSGAVSIMIASLIACGLNNVMVDDKGTVKPFSIHTDVTNDEHAKNLVYSKRWYLICCEPNFARLVVYSLTMFPLLKAFTHFDVTFPKSAVRQLGEGAMFGSVKAINCVIIVLFQAHFSHWFRNFHKYTVITIGAIISACAVFLFCAPPSYESWYAAFIIFTIGEMIFSHRVDDFATDLMPRGREGVYSNLTGLYMVIPNYVINSMSGWLLSTYCPVMGEKHCQMMWFIIGLMTCITPVLLFPLRPYLLGSQQQAHDAGLQPTPQFTIGEENTRRNENDDNDMLEMKVEK